MVQPSRILMIALIMALGLNALSLIRAHRKDLLVCRPQETLREKDRGLLRMNELYLTQNTGQKVPLEYHDVAFARFPVVVIKEKLPYVLYVDHQSSSEK